MKTAQTNSIVDEKYPTELLLDLLLKGGENKK